MTDSNKKGIIFIIGSMRRGGAERVISILANDYADKGWKVKIITLLDNSNDYVLKDSIEVISISDENKSRIQQLPNWLKKLRRLFKETDADVIVSFIARINILAILANFGLGKKLVISERNDPKSDGRSWIVKIATHILYPQAETIVFQTKWAKKCFPNYIQSKGVIIPNPIDVAIEASEIKEKKIIAVGRLIEQKNHKLIINAFSKVLVKNPDYKLYIYGEGKLRSELTNQIESLKISTSVFLPGNIVDIHEQIADTEMFVLSSNYEGLSNALLEAMMMGISCISTNCAGSNEVIIDGENGLLVPIGEEELLTEAILKLINDRELSRKIGLDALKSAKRFNSESILNRWKVIIENCNQVG